MMQATRPRFNRINNKLDPKSGQPYIRDLHITVATILGYLGTGKGVDDILREWPELEREDIFQALGYAAAEMAYRPELC